MLNGHCVFTLEFSAFPGLLRRKKIEAIIIKDECLLSLCLSATEWIQTKGTPQAINKDRLLT